MANSEDGFVFLCKILQTMYKSDERKSGFYSHIESGAVFNKDEALKIFDDWAKFTYAVSFTAADKDLTALLNEHFEKGKKFDTADYFFNVRPAEAKALKNPLKNAFENMLTKKNGTTPDNLAGMAATLTLGIGKKQDPQFYIGQREARAILTLSLNELNIKNVEFIPDSCFEILNSAPSNDLSELFCLGVFGALKTLYPHKADQRERNRAESRETVLKFVDEKCDSALFDSFKQVDEAMFIFDNIRRALKKESETVKFPDGESLRLCDFYTVPNFETMGNAYTDKILLCDKGYRARSLVIGNTGSGKTTLSNAVVRTCLKSDGEDIYAEYAARLGINKNKYFPLVLHCDRISENVDLSDKSLDLIELALEQLVRSVRETEYRSCLAHWDSCREMILEYLKQKAKSAELLLIVDGFSSLDSSRYEDFLSKLHTLGKEDYPLLHIMVTSQLLVKSLMRRFDDYNQSELAPWSDTPSNIITKLSDAGMSFNASKYRELTENRYVKLFLNTPSHLVKLLQYEFDEPFWGMDELLCDTIDEKLERHSGEDVSADDCREFLTALAVNIVERKSDYSAIPMNLANKRTNVADSVENPAAVWQFIRNKMILISPSSRINSFMFSNRLFCYSLAADFYLKLLENGGAATLLERFNRISAEDFSYMAPMLISVFRNMTTHTVLKAPCQTARFCYLCSR